ncbi:flagellar hook-associated protein FlgK [Gracilimonas mengyeensis]|uniref:Flagellar hook-associated protein 1 n=1 Tax=Gracilimonas mengyeensis TaxID=1302730 RepID=A0A521FIL2_9BACT|nr:flagellar hook-associated protein FlgK [Gracilimonas mengyeensis]SMO95844.1 flagellar hook-associated protein 1 FlgK [Gracilimonas mengyeensis]
MRSLLEISKTGLRTAERSLSVTSNNIINADTPGYSRQRVEKSPLGMQMTGYHSGLGVEITGYTRLRNEMNDVLMNQKQQDMSFMENKSKVFEQLETFLATDSGNDLDLNISNLLDSFSELSSDPQDMSVRHSLITNAQQLTQKFHDIDRNLERTSELTRESAIKTTDSINGILKEIYSLNQSIEQGQAAGQPDNTSLDIRVAKLEELSKLTGFESQFTDNGSVEIRIGGVSVLDSEKAQTLTPEIDAVNREFRVRLGSGKTVNVDSGKLGAEIEMYQTEIPELKQKVDDLAATMVNEFNSLHATGFGLNDNTNRNFFDPTGTTAADIKVNQVLIDDPAHVAASVSDTEAGNGSVAASIAELRNEKLIDGRKLVDYTVGLISSPGAELNSLNAQVEARDSELQMLKIQQEREAGVNIDEELSLMIQYQNAYQGAARVMASAQDMYDTLLGIMR